MSFAVLALAEAVKTFGAGCGGVAEALDEFRYERATVGLIF